MNSVMIQFVAFLLFTILCVGCGVDMEHSFDFRDNSLSDAKAVEVSRLALEKSNKWLSSMEIEKMDGAEFARNKLNHLRGYTIWNDSANDKSFTVYLEVKDHKVRCKVVNNKPDSINSSP